MASRDDDNAQVRRRVLRLRSIQYDPIIFCVDDPQLVTISSSSCKGLVPYRRHNATLRINLRLLPDPSSFIFLVLIGAAQEPDTFNSYDNLEANKKKIAPILQLREEGRDGTDFVAAMQEEEVANNIADWGQQQEGGGDDNAGGGEATEGGGGDAGDPGGGGNAEGGGGDAGDGDGGGDGDSDIQHPMIGENDAKCDFCRRMFGAWTCAPWCRRLQMCRTCRRREVLQPHTFCHICDTDLDNPIEHTIQLLDYGLENITVTCHPPQPLHQPPVPAYLAPPIPAHQEPEGDWQLFFHHTVYETPFFVALNYYEYELPDVPGVRRWYVYETHER